MNKFKIITIFILNFVFFSIIFTSVPAKNTDRLYKGSDISDYFSGILSIYDNNYKNSYNYLKRLDGLEENHYTYSRAYLNSLINLNKFNEAFLYAKKLEKKKINNFESDLIIGVFYLKKKKYELAQKYFTKIQENQSQDSLQKLIAESLLNWIQFDKVNSEDALILIKSLDPRYENIKKIQIAFANCFYDERNTINSFKKLLSDTNVNYSRYNFFLANYLISKNKKEESIEIVSQSLKKTPRNLILNQLKIDINAEKKINYQNKFNCKNLSHVMAEMFYILANAISVQSVYSVSNFYLNLAKFLNPDFISYETLLAENFYAINNFKKAKSIYSKIKLNGSAYNWYSAQKITSIMLKEKKIDQAMEYLRKNYESINGPNLYQMFDYAKFLKNNDNFIEAIKYYSLILKKIDSNHDLYQNVTDGRGVAYERIGSWNKAEKDFLNSLEANPNQAYVINYLAYSWIEKGKNINKSLEMLKKANELKKNDGFIIDSLGWALFKLKRFKEAEKYLQDAVKLMPSDPIVNDHYGDSLWMSGKKMQARYYWNYVLNLEKTEDELKIDINEKLISGPKTKL